MRKRCSCRNVRTCPLYLQREQLEDSLLRAEMNGKQLEVQRLSRQFDALFEGGYDIHGLDKLGLSRPGVGFPGHNLSHAPRGADTSLMQGEFILPAYMTPSPDELRVRVRGQFWLEQRPVSSAVQDVVDEIRGGGRTFPPFPH